MKFPPTLIKNHNIVVILQPSLRVNYMRLQVQEIQSSKHPSNTLKLGCSVCLIKLDENKYPSETGFIKTIVLIKYVFSLHVLLRQLFNIYSRKICVTTKHLSFLDMQDSKSFSHSFSHVVTFYLWCPCGKQSWTSYHFSTNERISKVVVMVTTLNIVFGVTDSICLSQC